MSTTEPYQDRSGRPRPVRRASALAYRPFRIYFIGSLLAMNALRLGAVAQGLLIWDLTGSVLSLGIIAAAVALPMMIVNVFGGVLADRFEARNILGGPSLVGAALLVTLGILDLNGIVQPWHVVTIAVMSGLVAGADQPSRQAYFPSLVPASALKSAITINGSLLASASVVAPTLGGLLIAAAATHVGFFVAAGGWVAMFIATLFLPRRGSSKNQRSVIRELATGFSFIRNHRVLLVLMVLTFSNMLMGLGGSACSLRMSISSEVVPGKLASCFLQLASGRHAGKLILGAAAAFSATMLLVANSPSLWFGMALAAVAHFGNGMFNISALVAVQLRVPDAIRGRVMGVFAISQSIGLLGGLWTGALAAAIGLRAGMLVGPIILLALIFTVFVTQRKVRELHEDPALHG